MYDYLTLNKFIAPEILLIAYYLGAIGLPIFLWYIRRYLIQKVLPFKNTDTLLSRSYAKLSVKKRRKVWLTFIALFITAELCWRILFEAMIGYFNMHDYLYEISKTLQTEEMKK